ncbi:MAG TPA: glutaminyl-peptide cyclotransferase, partial [Blastocatellia bacterium]|nr:glutaminyl-peptide cyclotransferase [Blastocatellia bacterium]
MKQRMTTAREVMAAMKFDALRIRFEVFARALLVVTAVAVLACGSASRSGPRPVNGDVPGGAVPVYTYQVVHTYPHDPAAFTQGLEFRAGSLYESTGQVGRSSLRKVDLQTGAVLKKCVVPPPYFTEGLTIFKGRIYQLTWLQHKGFIYDMDFNPIGEFRFDTEGWGLTHDGRSLIMSDGSNRLRFLDPDTFAVTKTISVNDGGRPLAELNELEYIDGEIYSNIWH